MKTRLLVFLSISFLSLAPHTLHAAKEQKIEDIFLKENPTKKDVADYLSALEKASRSTPVTHRQETEMGSMTRVTYTSTSSKALPEKLAKIPVAYLGLVLDRAKSAEHDFNSQRFAMAAVIMVGDRTDLDDTLKEAIISGVSEFPSLAPTVVRMDWIKGSEARLLKYAKASRPMLAQNFVELVAKIDTPESKKFMPDLLLRGRSQQMAACFKTALALDLPWLETDTLVPKAWKQIKEAPGRSPFDDPIHFAPIAARFGEVDALVMITQKLNGAANENLERNPLARRLLNESTVVLQQCIDADVLDTKSLVKLVLDNRDSLVFDKSTRKYRVRDTATAAAAK